MCMMQYGWAHGKVFLYIKIIYLFSLQARRGLYPLFALQKKAFMHLGQKVFGFSTGTLLSRSNIRLPVQCGALFRIIKKAYLWPAMLVFTIQTKQEQNIFIKQIF